MSIPILAAAAKAATVAIGGMGAPLQAALAVGTTVAQYSAETNLAKAQEASIRQANEVARVQTIDDYDQLTRVGLQEKAAAAMKNHETEIEAKKARASVKASAGEAGVGGLSVTSLLTDIYGREASIRDGVNQNIEATGQQLAVERKNTNRNYVNTVNTRPSVSRPSATGAVLSGASGIFSAYKDNLRLKAQLNDK